MKSIEAIQCVINDTDLEIYDIDELEEIVDGLKQALKDLEILEILKPKLLVEKGSTWEYLEVKHPFFDTQDEIDKVKEWLNNDNK